MAKWRKTTVAGPLVMEAVYPAINSRDSETVRREKKKLTSEARQRANDKAAYRKLELWLAANFTPGDLFLTLTYDDAHLPGSRKEALSRIRYFWRKLSAARAAKGQELRYIYVTEHKHGEGRWHHHVFINATGEDFEDIRKAWIYGKVQDYEKFELSRDKTYETMARYLTKETRDKPGDNFFNHSQNLRKPETETRRVDNDEELRPPNGAVVLFDTGDVRTAYGHYRFIKYMYTPTAKAPRAKRRRRRNI